MIDTRDFPGLELVAAYLGTAPDEVLRALRRGVTAETLAERFDRPRVGVEELLAQMLAART